jgi:hypothetical protein
MGAQGPTLGVDLTGGAENRPVGVRHKAVHIPAVVRDTPCLATGAQPLVVGFGKLPPATA